MIRRTLFAVLLLMHTIVTMAPSPIVRARPPQDGSQSVSAGADTGERSAILSAENVFKKASSAVVRIEVRDRDFRLVGQGSGFFVSGDGLVATNHHVIVGAHVALIQMPGGPTYFAEGIAGIDSVGDLALLKIKGDGFTFLELAEPHLPQIGAEVYTIGSPQGLANTISEGIVSGHRRLGELGGGEDASRRSGSGGERESAEVMLIQTTAPISPGSSGGPLISGEGTVVGVVTSHLAGGQNLNFAVPVRRLIALIQNRGNIRPLSIARGKPLGHGEADQLQQVWGAIEKQDYGQALRLLGEVRERQRSSAPYCFAVGVVHDNLGNLELAADAYQSAIRFAPKIPLYHHALAAR